MTKGQKIPKERRAKLGFHGTNYDFEDVVKPNFVTGNMHYDISGRDDTYFLPADSTPEINKSNETQAWNWTPGTVWGAKGTPSRQRVHITRPIGVQHADYNLNGAVPESTQALKQQAAVAPAQEILDTHWAPPPEEGQHVTQTLPHVNWNQFGAPNWQTTLHAKGSLPAETLSDAIPRDVDWRRRERSYMAMDKGNAITGRYSEEPLGPPAPKPKRPKKGQGVLDFG